MKKDTAVRSSSFGIVEQSWRIDRLTWIWYRTYVYTISKKRASGFLRRWNSAPQSGPKVRTPSIDLHATRTPSISTSVIPISHRETSIINQQTYSNIQKSDIRSKYCNFESRCFNVQSVLVPNLKLIKYIEIHLNRLLRRHKASIEKPQVLTTVHTAPPAHKTAYSSTINTHQVI